MLKYYIKTDKGFLRDFILAKYVDDQKEAQIFDSMQDAQAMQKALEVLDQRSCEIIVEALDHPEKDELLDLMKKYIDQAEMDAAINAASDEILVVVVEPFKKPYKKIIANHIDPMNEIVGGYIEIINLHRSKTGAQICITCNEEGKLMNLPFNRRIIGFDIIAGTFFLTAYNMQGDNISLTDQDAADLIKKFTPIEIYL